MNVLWRAILIVVDLAIGSRSVRLIGQVIEWRPPFAEPPTIRRNAPRTIPQDSFEARTATNRPAVSPNKLTDSKWPGFCCSAATALRANGAMAISQRPRLCHQRPPGRRQTPPRRLRNRRAQHRRDSTGSRSFGKLHRTWFSLLFHFVKAATGCYCNLKLLILVSPVPECATKTTPTLRLASAVPFD